MNPDPYRLFLWRPRVQRWKLYIILNDRNRQKKNLPLNTSPLTDKMNQEQKQPCSKREHRLHTPWQVSFIRTTRHSTNVTSKPTAGSAFYQQERLQPPPCTSQLPVSLSPNESSADIYSKAFLVLPCLRKKNKTKTKQKKKPKQTEKYIKSNTFNLYYFWITSSVACPWKASILQTFN